MILSLGCGLAACLGCGLAACSRTGLELPASATEGAALTEGPGGLAGLAPPQAPAQTNDTVDGQPVGCRTADKLDLLFVVDNSGSMAEEQAALSEQLPRLVQVLVSGQRPDGSRFPAATSVHVGVVTTDMGLPGVTGIDKCDGFGDDGRLSRPRPMGAACQPPADGFLRFNAGDDVSAGQLSCLFGVGIEGCGFEQQLEAGLKALWPADDIDPMTGMTWVDPVTGVPGNRITFLNGTLGHGDGENAGFLRNDSAAGLSLVAVVLVTDEEDCSSVRTTHFTPPNQVDADDVLREQDLNLRCFFNPDSLFAVQRYIDGLRALRPNNPDLVLFSAIVGVPVGLVTPDALAAVDFRDSASREAFYDNLLADPAMQERIQPNTPPGQGQLEPSCQTASGLAFPPRRIVETARGFGDNGLVQSICQADFTPAVDRIIERLATRLGPACRGDGP